MRLKEVYRYSMDSFKNIHLIVDYFNKFPLKTTKKDSFSKWCNIYYKMIQNEHLTNIGFVDIQRLAKLVNNNPFNNTNKIDKNSENILFE